MYWPSQMQSGSAQRQPADSQRYERGNVETRLLTKNLQQPNCCKGPDRKFRQDSHEHELPMRVLRTYAVQVNFAGIGRQAHGERNTSCGKAIVSGGKTWSIGACGIVSLPISDVHNLDLNRSF